MRALDEGLGSASSSHMLVTWVPGSSDPPFWPPQTLHICAGRGHAHTSDSSVAVAITESFSVQFLTIMKSGWFSRKSSRPHMKVSKLNTTMEGVNIKLFLSVLRLASSVKSL